MSTLEYIAYPTSFMATLLVLILTFLPAFGTFTLVEAVRTAPEGYEDARGFHHGPLQLLMAVPPANTAASISVASSSPFPFSTSATRLSSSPFLIATKHADATATPFAPAVTAAPARFSVASLPCSNSPLFRRHRRAVHSQSPFSPPSAAPFFPGSAVPLATGGSDPVPSSVTPA